ncbi:MAG TPA: FAD-dependent oxidoreductase [Actinoplanes sp.]|nr:FAD-dependent oxidoreductase [Actinoplanes sp.]
MTHLAVAIVGAGPAGIHTAAALASAAPGTRIDIHERLPHPYGLIRHGVTPDHPDRIARLCGELAAALAASGARLFCGADIGTGTTVAELRGRYDAVVIATGARHDAPLDLPGIDLPGSFGAADFVAWYTGRPDAPPEWPLTAESVAVIGAGNVALDITRMLARPDSAARDIHLFARRGPADTRFSATELRELGDLPGVDVLVDPVDLVPDRHLDRMTRQFPPTRKVLRDGGPGRGGDHQVFAGVDGVGEIVEQVGEVVAGGLPLVAGQLTRPGGQHGSAPGLPLTRISGDGHTGRDHAVQHRPPGGQVLAQVVVQRLPVVDEQFDGPAPVAARVPVRRPPVTVRQEHDDVEIRTAGALRGGDATRQHRPPVAGKQLGHQGERVGQRVTVHRLSLTCRRPFGHSS